MSGLWTTYVLVTQHDGALPARAAMEEGLHQQGYCGRRYQELFLSQLPAWHCLFTAVISASEQYSLRIQGAMRCR